MSHFGTDLRELAWALCREFAFVFLHSCEFEVEQHDRRDIRDIGFVDVPDVKAEFFEIASTLGFVDLRGVDVEFKLETRVGDADRAVAVNEHGRGFDDDGFHTLRKQ